MTGLTVREVIADFATVIPVRERPKKQVLAFEKVSSDASEEFTVELEEYSAMLFRLYSGAPGSFTTSQVCAREKVRYRVSGLWKFVFICMES